jgi:microcystin degradation protein MlrC
VVAEGDAAQAEREADYLADEFWRRRAAFAVELTPAAQAIARALADDRHPYVLSDSADSPSSGAPGDSSVILAALIAAQPDKRCLVNVVDAAAVDEMVRAGVGQMVTVRLGGLLAPQFYAPVEVTGRVKLISDGEFTHKGQGFQGVTFYRGRTAVLRTGNIDVVVMERPVFQWDAELYRSLGLEPRDAQIVVVKSPTAFRASYGPFAAEIVIVEAAGVCSPVLRSYPFKRVHRPLYPLDDFEDWRAARSN